MKSHLKKLLYFSIIFFSSISWAQVCNVADIGNCSGNNCQYRYTTNGSSNNYQVVGIPFTINLSDLPDSCYAGAGASITIRGIGVNGPIYDVPSPMLFTIGTQPTRILNGANTDCHSTYENTNSFINIDNAVVNANSPVGLRVVGSNSACPVVTFDMANLVRLPSSQIGLSNNGPLAAIQYRRWAVAVPPHCINTPLQTELIAGGTAPAAAQTAARVGPGMTINTYTVRNPLPPAMCGASIVSATCNNDLTGMFTAGSALGTSTTCENGCSVSAVLKVPAGSNTYYSDTNPVGTCASVSQARTCSGGDNTVVFGTMSGNALYQYDSCTPGCGTIEGVPMRNNVSRVFYTETSSFDCASKAQTRTCTNGALDVIGTAANASCTPTALAGGDCGVTYTAGAAVQVNDVTVPAGSSIIKPANWNIISYGGTTLNGGRLYCPLCTPGTTISAGCPAIANGQSVRTCAGDGMSWGSCQSSCNASLTVGGVQPNITCTGANNCTWTFNGVSANESKKYDLFAGFKKLKMLKPLISENAYACQFPPPDCDFDCTDYAGAACGAEGATNVVACQVTNNCQGGCQPTGTSALYTCHCVAPPPPPAGVACNLFDSVNQPNTFIPANGSRTTDIVIPTTGTYTIPIDYTAHWDDHPISRCMNVSARVVKVTDLSLLGIASFPNAVDAASAQCTAGGADTINRSNNLVFNATAGETVRIYLTHTYQNSSSAMESATMAYVTSSSGFCPVAAGCPTQVLTWAGGSCSANIAGVAAGTLSAPTNSTSAGFSGTATFQCRVDNTWEPTGPENGSSCTGTNDCLFWYGTRTGPLADDHLPQGGSRTVNESAPLLARIIADSRLVRTVITPPNLSVSYTCPAACVPTYNWGSVSDNLNQATVDPQCNGAEDPTSGGTACSAGQNNNVTARCLAGGGGPGDTFAYRCENSCNKSNCGAANGVASAVQPAANLCVNAGYNPFKWSNGATWFWHCGSQQCSAPKIAEPTCWRALCGGSRNMYFIQNSFTDVNDCESQGLSDYCVGGPVSCTLRVADPMCPGGSNACRSSGTVPINTFSPQNGAGCSRYCSDQGATCHMSGSDFDLANGIASCDCLP